LPSRHEEWKKNSLHAKTQVEKAKPIKFKKNAYINLVGCLDNDLKKRVMITIQPHETLNHLSNHIGQLMQKYRMFENLLGLRASEIKVVQCSHKGNDDDSDIESGK
jgi:hypothetical protein